MTVSLFGIDTWRKGGTGKSVRKKSTGMIGVSIQLKRAVRRLRLISSRIRMS